MIFFLMIVNIIQKISMQSWCWWNACLSMCFIPYVPKVDDKSKKICLCVPRSYIWHLHVYSMNWPLKINHKIIKKNEHVSIHDLFIKFISVHFLPHNYILVWLSIFQQSTHPRDLSQHMAKGMCRGNSLRSNLCSGHRSRSQWSHTRWLTWCLWFDLTDLGDQVNTHDMTWLGQ